MKNGILSAVICLPLLLGCSAAQVQKADSALEAACSEASGLLSLASFIPGAGQIATYIKAGCGTAEGLAKLASDKSSAAWVGTLIQKVKDLAAKAGVKIA